MQQERLLDLDAPGSFPWWTEGHRTTTLGAAMIRVLGEENSHGGHLAIVRELIDGHADDNDTTFATPEEWKSYVAKVQASADSFRLTPGPPWSKVVVHEAGHDGAMSQDPGARLVVASLNTWGMSVRGSHLVDRYRAIGSAFEASAVDVVNFQEVLTYYHLRQLEKALPSFAAVSYRQSLVGPAGGVVTLSRRPVDGTRYRRFPMLSAAETSGVSRLTRFKAPLKGALITRLVEPDVSIVNTHLLANFDGDWSQTNRFYPVHRSQLAGLARVVSSVPGPAIISGDFNISRESTLHRDFLAETELIDAFGGQCPPTFHADFLEAGKTPQCIDFVLLAGPIEVLDAEVIFTGEVAMPSGPGYVSDHLGLRAEVVIAR
jgi:endonuclease/exonuclease/phosphatase family metal-dependent hydrolase